MGILKNSKLAVMLAAILGSGVSQAPVNPREFHGFRRGRKPSILESTEADKKRKAHRRASNKSRAINYAYAR